MDTADCLVSADDPFHEGERVIQARAGSRARMAEIGSRLIRDFMPDQHRDFFRQLPFVVAAACDGQGRPWATLLGGPPGFCRSDDPQRLAVGVQPAPGDPLDGWLGRGAPVGLLGIEPQTRRRNRVNGQIVRADGLGFELRVDQSFGNCPKYIQPHWAHHVEDSPGVLRSDDAPMLHAPERALVAHANMLFIGSTDAGRSVDVSHRGGAAGFVRVDDAHTLTMPDYTGNAFFNTLGNLQSDPRAGLLFIDFASGERLHVAVDATIVWDGPDLASFPGALRLLRMAVREVRRVSGGLPLRWTLPAM
jgi:uncharacterized protein